MKTEAGWRIEKIEALVTKTEWDDMGNKKESIVRELIDDLRGLAWR
jgi:hypothetical protein